MGPDFLEDAVNEKPTMAGAPRQVVIGLDLLASAFGGLEDQYVLIGGAAADLWFRREQSGV